MFWEVSCFFYDPKDVGDLNSGSSVFSKSNLNTWKFSVHVLLKPVLENFLGSSVKSGARRSSEISALVLTAIYEAITIRTL